MRYDFHHLLKSCRELDRRAQRQMLDLLAPFLLGVCRRYAPQTAQDMTQEALILIFNNIQQCRPEEKPFMAWCRRIAVNVCLGQLRKRKIHFETIDEATEAQAVYPEAIGQFEAEEILRLLDELPENQRIVFNLYVIDGYDHAEISQMLQIKESSSRAFLARARAALQTMITEQAHTDHAYR